MSKIIENWMQIAMDQRQALAAKDAEIAELRKALDDGCINWCGCHAAQCKIEDCSAYKVLVK